MREVIAGGELAPIGEGLAPAEYRSTVHNPDYVTAAASRDRLDLLHDAGGLELGLDVADTIEVRDSIELMLSHQLAVAHRSVMKLAAQLNRQIECMNILHDERRQRANVEATRIVGAMARLMTAHQQGTLTLQRLRSGGRQVLTVQHVTVAEGAQAIVAGKVLTGGSRGASEGGTNKNEQ
jgi:hypothetical protein